MVTIYYAAPGGRRKSPRSGSIGKTNEPMSGHGRLRTTQLYIFDQADMVGSLIFQYGRLSRYNIGQSKSKSTRYENTFCLGAGLAGDGNSELAEDGCSVSYLAHN
jgi:hypothetical protein